MIHDSTIITSSYPCIMFATYTDQELQASRELFQKAMRYITEPEIYIVENFTGVKFNVKYKNLIKRLRAITRTKPHTQNQKK